MAGAIKTSLRQQGMPSGGIRICAEGLGFRGLGFRACGLDVGNLAPPGTIKVP